MQRPCGHAHGHLPMPAQPVVSDEFRQFRTHAVRGSIDISVLSPAPQSHSHNNDSCAFVPPLVPFLWRLPYASAHLLAEGTRAHAATSPPEDHHGSRQNRSWAHIRWPRAASLATRMAASGQRHSRATRPLLRNRVHAGCVALVARRIGTGFPADPCGPRRPASRSEVRAGAVGRRGSRAGIRQAARRRRRTVLACAGGARCRSPLHAGARTD